MECNSALSNRRNLCHIQAIGSWILILIIFLGLPAVTGTSSNEIQPFGTVIYLNLAIKTKSNSVMKWHYYFHLKYLFFLYLCGHRLQICAFVTDISEPSGWFYLLYFTLFKVIEHFLFVSL